MTTMDRIEVRQRGVYHRCAHHGVWFPLVFLRRFRGAEAVTDVIIKAVDSASPSGSETRLKCPNCFRPMLALAVGAPISRELDHCNYCNSIWFDLGELEQVREKGELEPQFPQAPSQFTSTYRPPATPELLFPSDEKSFIDDGDFHDLHFLGLPTRDAGQKRVKQLPICTVVVTLFSIAMTVGWIKDPNSWSNWAFNPHEPFRHYGLTWLTSLFLHAGWLHCLGNMYFLLLCGSDVEEELGSSHFFGLFFLGGVVGHIATMWLASRSEGQPIFSLGASGGVSASLMYYALAFPKHRLNISQFWSGGRRFWSLLNYEVSTASVSTGTFLFIFLLQSVVGSIFQVYDSGSDVNHLAHLTGILMGFVFYGMFPRTHSS